MVSIFLRNDNIKVKVPQGMNLRQVATKSNASMEFGCRVGDCGTCIAKVEQGEDILAPKNKKEIKVLEILGSAYEGCRLMCQCAIEASEGEVVISYVCP